ncbi:hypothetical protein ACXYMX_16495 [Sporosarcina sp. CAU 1771]
MNAIVNNSLVIIGVSISLILATTIGIYAQDMSYYLNNRYPQMELTTAITALTFPSIGLYIMNPILLLKLLKLKKVYVYTCMIASVLIGLPVSLFSFFVWGMWMG